MNEEINAAHVSPFEAIRREDADGNEYWSARDLAKVLGYVRWDKFKNAIEKAEVACENSGQAVSDHFSHVGKMIDLAKGARRQVDDVYLSRYACYLIVQNADPSKPIVALGQTYFAVQTRRQELADELAALPEDQLRLLPSRLCGRLFLIRRLKSANCVLCTIVATRFIASGVGGGRCPRAV